ncbi:hypothetical protein FRC12_024830 [Ceratobasidium sp. 428]|nr:hypothetical protein FRC12_024830 [Ceratobasidium sp. 428]
MEEAASIGLNTNPARSYAEANGVEPIHVPPLNSSFVVDNPHETCLLVPMATRAVAEQKGSFPPNSGDERRSGQVA